MKKLPLLISLLSAIAVTGANAEVLDLKEDSASKPSADCSMWKSENLIDKSDSRLKFVKGISHCLQQVDRSDMSPSQSEREFREMHNRFYDVYDTLKDTEARVKFTLLFINQVSVLYKVGVREIQNENHALIFSYTLESGHKTLRLMKVTSNKENDYFPTERDYIKFGNASGFTKDLEALVSYVINGKKQIQLKELDIDVSPMTSDDEAYVVWAEEQAQGTCDYMDCGYEWRTNEYGEDYILFSLEDPFGNWDFWEGYHYTPENRYR